jgi:hypothetical protein
MKDLLANIIASSLHNLFAAQPNLSQFVQQETREREPNLSSHFANELRNYLYWLDYDFDVIKTLHHDQRPDIILHKRGSKALNFLAVEVKRETNPVGIQEDLQKIRNDWFGGSLKYSFGASVVIDEQAKTFKVELLDRQDPYQPYCATDATYRHIPLPKFKRVRRSTVHKRVERIVTTHAADATADLTKPLRALTDLVRLLYSS